MGIRRRIGSVALVLALLGVACMPGLSWGQEEQRIGTVLAVEGTAEVRTTNATTWEAIAVSRRHLSKRYGAHCSQ